MLGAYQGAQLSNAGLDPNFGHNEGPFGALGKIIAAARGGPMLQQGVEQATAANNASRPDLLAALSNQSGPLAYASQNPGMNPVALSQVLAMGPEAAAKYIDTARLARANAPNAAPLIPTTTTLPGWGKLNAPGGGAGGSQQPLPMTVGPAATGRYGESPNVAGAEAAPQQPAADPLTAAAAMSPAQRQMLMQNPQVRAQILAQMRARHIAPVQTGGGNALRPPT
jgi:hypothetical protein